MKKRVEKSSKEKVDKTDSVTDEEPPKTADDYQCSGHLEQDFTKLCKLMGVKDIPSVKIKQSSSLESKMTTWSSKPCLRIELENEDHGSVKEVKISGWKMDEVVLQVLSRILPSLSNLQCLHMWRVGLTDYTFTSMRNTVSLCSNLRKVVLEGNPLPEQSYHLLIAEDSILADSHERPLSVRSSSSLDRLNKSTKNPTKKKDNPKKEEKPAAGQAAKKEEPKVAKKDNKVPRIQAGKLAGKDNNLLVSEQEDTFVCQRVDVVETVIPLLDPGIVHAGGKVIHPGNTCLTSLNLSGDFISELI
ncbi:leucine-rich repeat-containing protein 71-like [Sinocyclocheilus grahami]|uniref:leucine-rich repeat-containing protein 71-like n=1 Tax=Sinocyclocheilus grahami TaxID=75366 RepID=UPI0007AC9C6C|nr:PREDICTED: leucine-rich repeat-containing protein 71-like [Sinocyclocheilus grahami]